MMNNQDASSALPRASLDRAEQQLILVLRRAHARGQRFIPMPELIQSALIAGELIDGVVAEAYQGLLARGRLTERPEGVSLT